MALEWHRRSGKSARDGICRSLARKGLDMFDMAGVSVVAGYNYSSRHLIEGVVCNQVAESLGASKHELICNQPTVLRNIHYCQSGLSFVDGDQNAHKDGAIAKPSIINHDYLVLELSYGTDPSSTLFIRAEKTGHPPQEAGIRVTVDEHYNEEARGSCNCLFTIRCYGRDIGRLRQIEAILVDFNPHYSLRDHNCWQYTRRMARRLLWECQQSPGLSDEELRLLQIEEDNVERRIASIHLKRVVQKSKQGLKTLWKAWASAP